MSNPSRGKHPPARRTGEHLHLADRFDGWEHGTPVAYLRDMVDHWRTACRWALPAFSVGVAEGSGDMWV